MSKIPYCTNVVFNFYFDFPSATLRAARLLRLPFDCAQGGALISTSSTSFEKERVHLTKSSVHRFE